MLGEEKTVNITDVSNVAKHNMTKRGTIDSDKYNSTGVKTLILNF